ncbi:polysaccharide pyruvyl transferase family protein [Porticoccaceae bacterium]|nr:polysaccharide pyruvyl transferase family protein [Porticoccaceae bacterium]
MSKKKIGIFTITDALNYGAFYQMFGLYSYLKDQGHEVVLYSGTDSLKRLVVKYFSPNIRRLIRKTHMRNLFRSDESSLIIKRYKGEKLDVAVLGSDEIWNLDNNSFTHHDYYFGIGVNATKILAYAPSVGYCSMDTFTQHSQPRNVANLYSCMVRDKQTEELAKIVGGNKIAQVVDPTILYNNWEKHIQKSNMKAPYYLYYGYDTNPYFKYDLIARSREQGIKLVSAGYNVHDWCDVNLNVTPFQFLGLIKASKAFYTSTFHGTVMASILRHPFTVSTKSQKVLDFLSKFSLENHIYSDPHYEVISISDESYRKIIESSNHSRKILKNAAND